MRQAILATKLFVPTPRPERVFRDRLINQLNECSDQKLTLISAPAGFGKTTLVSEWVQLIQKENTFESVVWLSIDAADNDPARFLTYVITAFRQIEAQLAKGAVTALDSPQPTSFENTLTYLINEIISLEKRIVFVLDDYHLIESREVNQAVKFLLENIPPNLHLVISTREDPGISLARLRASGEMNEIRAADLRFSTIETQNFFNSIQGLKLTEDDIHTLESRTEGWIAGLQLAAISLKGQLDPSKSIKQFSGSHHLVLDYLIDEVLNRQTEKIQHFLLQTSILDRFTGSLCEQITDQANSQEILEELHRANLFIVPLDDERRWYRYHHLFADLLQQRLHKLLPDQIRSLHQQASAWYKENELIEEAIEHLLLIKDYSGAVPLIDMQNELAWKGGDLARLYRWIRLLPENVLVKNPGLCVVRAWDMGRSGQLEAAEKCLQTAEKTLDDNHNQLKNGSIEISVDDKKVIKAVAATIRSFLAFYEGDVGKTKAYAQEALSSLPEKNTIWRVNALIALGDSYSLNGEIKEASELRRKGWEESKASGNTYMNLIASMKLVINLRQLGHIDQVLEICQEQDSWAQEIGLTHTAEYGWLLAIWGEMLAEVNSLDEALEKTTRGLQLAKGGDIVIASWAYMCHIRALYSRGEFAGAESTLHQQDLLSKKGDVAPWLAEMINHWRIRLWLLKGKSEKALVWLNELGIMATETPTNIHSMDLLALCRTLIAAGRPQETIDILDQILLATRERGHISKTIDVLLVSALAHDGCGNQPQAMNFMKEALLMAEPNGFFQVFIDQGPSVARLLYSAIDQKTHTEFASKLLSAFPINDQHENQAPSDKKIAGLTIDPLSDREIEVLELIADGLTNNNIAEKLFLSLNTVKSHTRSIYAKLDVSSRTQAISKARSLGIITSA